MKKPDGKYMGTVKVGSKGQIVIPKEVREMFGIQSGDSLIILADKERGIAIERMSVFNHIAETIFKGKGKAVYPEHSEEESLAFAEGIKKLNGEDEENEFD